jgi:hypothetical protein
MALCPSFHTTSLWVFSPTVASYSTYLLLCSDCPPRHHVDDPANLNALCSWPFLMQRPWLPSTSATHPHSHTLDFVFTWNCSSSESLNITIPFFLQPSIFYFAHVPEGRWCNEKKKKRF